LVRVPVAVRSSDSSRHAPAAICRHYDTYLIPNASADPEARAAATVRCHPHGVRVHLFPHGAGIF
jgi:hypothetical protein